MYYIYQITNKLNNKFYIGKTTKTINQRFKRHVYDAENGLVHTHLSSAILKYGKDNFKIEVIDIAKSIEELNQKEIYWIHKKQAVKHGYNLSDGGDGGNTYQYKTDKDMEQIKNVLRQSKIGKNNPLSRKIKCKNVKTNKELFFDSLSECQTFFGETDHNFITRRCNHKIKCLYKQEWIFAYIEDEYINDYTVYKNNRKSRTINIITLHDNQSYIFHSYAEAERYFHLPQKFLSSKAYLHKDEKYWIKGNYKITVLN